MSKHKASPFPGLWSIPHRIWEIGFDRRKGFSAKIQKTIQKKYGLDLSRSKIKGLLAYHLMGGYSLHLQGISFNLTPDCNLRCRMCWEYREGGIYTNMKRSDREDMLTLPALCDVIDDIAPYNPNVILWGGEPFLYPHFIEFAEYVKSKGLFLQVITNGTLIKKYAEKLVDMGMDKIVISIDGPEEIHDEIRGIPGTFKKVKEGIEAIEQLRYHRKSGVPEMWVNLTVTEMNCGGLVKTVEYLESFDLESLILTQLWFATENIGKRHTEVFQKHFKVTPTSWKGFLTDVSRIDYRLTAQQLSQLKTRPNKFPIQFIPDIGGEDICRYYTEPEERFRHNTCLVPWQYTAITYNGDITPCSDRPDYIVGNVRETKLSELWNHPAYRRFRNTQKRLGLFPICSRCCQLYMKN